MFKKQESHEYTQAIHKNHTYLGLGINQHPIDLGQSKLVQALTTGNVFINDVYKIMISDVFETQDFKVRVMTGPHDVDQVINAKISMVEKETTITIPWFDNNAILYPIKPLAVTLLTVKIDHKLYRKLCLYCLR